MNKIFLLMMFLLVIPSAFAANENGKITAGSYLLITDLDITVDGRTSRNLEYNSDVSKIANPNSDVKIKIKVENNHTDLEMTEIDMIITIDELDLEEVISEFDMSKSSDKTITVNFKLPSDTEEQDYEIFIEAEGELNDSIHRVQFVVDLEVEEPEEEEITSQSTATRIDNLTAKLNDIGSYFGPYATCVSDLATEKEKVGTRDETIKNLQGYENKFSVCNTQLLDCNIVKEQKSAANETLYNLIISQYIPELESKKNNLF